MGVGSFSVLKASDCACCPPGEPEPCLETLRYCWFVIIWTNDCATATIYYVGFTATTGFPPFPLWLDSGLIPSQDVGGWTFDFPNGTVSNGTVTFPYNDDSQEHILPGELGSNNWYAIYGTINGPEDTDYLCGPCDDEVIDLNDYDPC